MSKITMSQCGLTKNEQRELKTWRNGWGTRLWRSELRRFWSGESSPLDNLWTNDKALLMSMRPKVEPFLGRLVVNYSGPDRD